MIKYFLLIFISFNSYASLNDCINNIKSIYNEIEPHKFELIKRAGLPIVRNPDLKFNKAIESFKTEQDCLTFKSTWIDLIYAKKSEFEAEELDTENEIKECKNLKKLIKNVTYTEFASLTSDKRFENIFNALKCLTKEK